MTQKSWQATARQELLRGIGDRIAWLGFNPRISQQIFWRKSNNAAWFLHVSFIPHRDDFDVTADVAIRIDEIEQLVNQYDTKLRPSERRRSSTLGAELGNLSQGHTRRWTVSHAADVPSICDQIVEAFERIGIPFLQEFSELENAHAVLVSSEPRHRLLCPVLGPQAMRAVASTHLLGKTREIARLVRELEVKLTAKQDLYLDDFRTLCRGLMAE